MPKCMQTSAGMELFLYLPSLLYHAMPSLHLVLIFCSCTFLKLISVTVRPKPKKNILSSARVTLELEIALTV